MRINNNIMALNTHRQLGINNTNTQKSLEKLSSGFRINRAGDDAAGLAISEKMRGQIRGLNMASKNAQDGISLIQTAEGGLNETHDILQRMRELAVQSSNDTNVKVDRGEIQKEVNQLAAEITRIADTTEFNTQNLLGGKFEAKFHVGANEGQNVDLAINAMDANTLKVAEESKVNYAGQTTTTEATNGITANTTFTVEAVTGSVDDEAETTANTIEVTHVLKNESGQIEAVSADGKAWWALTEASNDLTGVTIKGDTGDTDTKAFTFTTGVKSGTVTSDANGTKLTQNVELTFAEGVKPLADGKYTVSDDGVKLTDSSGNEVATSTDKMTFKRDGVTLFTASGELTSKTLNISSGGIDVSTQETADKAITTINKAIETVSAERSKLGAMQNRLEHTIKNLDTSAENLQAAESRIRDVDMAKEMMEFTKQNILQQAATAMLAQANMAPQSVLKLLG